ncbi:hypothetical protein GGR57DRAFT_456167 [Xylariaceae sp. FL1272]|nr:hypothetical protein GGR57DRAFT_456167 [Xylariaceae sp. FL1272]
MADNSSKGLAPVQQCPADLEPPNESSESLKRELLLKISNFKSSSLPLFKSRWFSRGWTLQEMIASPKLIFYDSKWRFYNSKENLAEDIAAVTGIDASVLHAAGHELRVKLNSIPVCRKMAWAAKRKTKRIEDRAYSLLGIFGVYMPLVYGEGANAFQRLQKEIIQVTNDLTIFAWKHPRRVAQRRPFNILAESPMMFEKSNDIVLSQDLAHNPHFVITNKGLQVTIPISAYGERFRTRWMMSLYCHRRNTPQKTLGILLEEVTGTVFRRIKCDGLLQVPYKASESLIFLTTDMTHIAPQGEGLGYHMTIHWYFSHGIIRLLSYYPETYWSGDVNTKSPSDEPRHDMFEHAFATGGATAFLGIIIYQAFHGVRAEKFVVICGFDPEVTPWLGIGTKGSELWDAGTERDYERAKQLASESKAQKAIIDLKPHSSTDPRMHIYITSKVCRNWEKGDTFTVRAIKLLHGENETCARCKVHGEQDN